MRNRLALLSLLTALLSTGCSSSDLHPTQDPPDRAQTLEVNAPPKQVLQEVKQAVQQPPLSLPIESEKDGMFLTGWQRYRGEFHIARYWQEQTRYRIEVVPDWNDPTAKGTVRVTDQTEQRATTGQPWEPAWDLDRSDRAKKVLSQIKQALQH